MKVSALACIFLLTGASSAFAGDGEKALAVPVAFDWSGAYAGVHLGYGWGAADFTDAQYNGAPPYPTVNWDTVTDGFLGGGQAGYNWQYGRAVLGLEGEVGTIALKGSRLQPGVDPLGFPYDAYGVTDGGWYGGISARLGYALGPTLFYSKVGTIYSEAELGFRDNCITAPCGNVKINAYEKLGWGYTLGTGMEHAITGNWSIKAEYAYVDFGDTTITGTGVGGGSNGVIFNVGADLSAHTVKTGLNYRF